MENLFVEVEKAVYVLYNAQDNVQRQEADKWLCHFSGTKEAWLASKTLLSSAKPIELQFFGATLLTKKIKEDWVQLTEPEQVQFSQYIINLAILFASGERIVKEKLATAVAATIIKSTHTWLTALNDLFNILHHPPNNNSVDVSILLLSIIGRLPEELEAARMSFDQSEKIKNKLSEIEPTLVQYVADILQQPASPLLALLKQSSLTCLRLWSRTLSKIFRLKEAIPPRILDLVFDSMKNGETFHVATDFLIEVFTRRSNDSPKFKTALETARSTLSLGAGEVNYFFVKILLTKNQYDSALKEKNWDVCRQLALLVSGIAETNSTYLASKLEGNELVNNIFQYLLHITNHPVREISELTLQIWEILETLLQKRTEYVPVYGRLLQVLFLQCSYSKEYGISKDESEAEREILNHYRGSAKGTLKASYAVLGPQLVLFLTSQIQQQTSWKELECVLFCIRTLSDRLPVSEPMVGALIEHVTQLFKRNSIFGNKDLTLSCLRFIDSSTTWLQANSHPNLAVSCLELVMPYLSNSDSEISFCSGMAFKKICSINLAPGGHMGNHLAPMVGVIAKDYTKIRAEDRIPIMEGLAAVLSVAPPEQSLPFYHTMVTLICTHVRTLNSTPQSIESRDGIKEDLRSLAALFTHTGERPLAVQPILSTVEVIYKLLSDLQAAWLHPNGTTVIEALHHVLKVLVGTLQTHSSTLVGPALGIVWSTYKYSPMAACLEVLNDTLSIFGKDDTKAAYFKKLLTNVSQKTFHVVQQDISHSDDLVREFFSLLITTLTKCPHLVQYLNYNDILLLSAQSLRVQDLSLIKTTLSLQTHMLTQAPNNSAQPQAQGAYLLHGRLLLYELLTVLVRWGSHYEVVPAATEILYILVRLQPHVTVVYLSEVFSRGDIFGGIFSENDKKMVVEMMVRAPNPRKFKMLMKDVLEVANGMQTVDVLVGHVL